MCVCGGSGWYVHHLKLRLPSLNPGRSYKPGTKCTAAEYYNNNIATSANNMIFSCKIVSYSTWEIMSKRREGVASISLVEPKQDV